MSDVSEILPTHRVIADGSLVHPSGHDPADLELIPAGYFEAQAIEMAVETIKSEAAQAILEAAPLWRQIEDLWTIIEASGLPVPKDIAARRDRIVQIKDQSNADEKAISAALAKRR